MPIAALEKTRFEEQQVLRIHLVSPRTEIQRAMGAAIHEITSALKEQGVTPSGPWFAHHHRRPTETFDFDVCFPVASPVQISGRLENVTIPATKVVRTLYRGPYEGLVSAWPEFLKQLTAAGYNVRPDVFEVYLVGPAQTQDPEAWETGLNCPLAANASQQGARVDDTFHPADQYRHPPALSQHRYRSDHPEAVSETDRTHGLRRVPVL